MSENKLRVIVMGCGGSGGVPYAGNVWGKCDPSNPKNSRMRPSIYLQQGDTRLVIDTGPDFRLQLNKTGIREDELLDAVLYTHAHCDHIVGLDDLRTFWYRSGKQPVPVYGSKEALDEITTRFNYAFFQSDDEYPATVQAHILPEKLAIKGMEIHHFEQIHGKIKTTGYRVGDFAYSTDVNELPPESIASLQGVKTWIVGAFHNDEGSYNHAGFDKIREWVDAIKPEMTYLTHLTSGADYDELCRILPSNIRPAYDGMELWI